MSKITANEAIQKAKNLVGVDTDYNHCDVAKAYGGFDTSINAVACCCMGMMYLFGKLSAMELIPGGKTASCGQLALNFYNAGQLYKPSAVKPGDLVIFSWSGQLTTYDSRLRAAGYKTFDHVEIVTAVSADTITAIGCNNGGAECDDFQIKTRRRADISGCCRPDYASRTAAKPTSESVKTVQKWLNAAYKSGLAEDNVFGAKTKAALIKAVQSELNKAYGSELKADGVFGTKTAAAVRNLKKGSKGALVKLLQAFLIIRGFDTGGFDGVYGNKTEAAVRSFQKSKSLTADGIAGKQTFAALCK